MPKMKGLVLEKTGNCLYCGRHSHSLVGGFCSPKCDSQAQIYGVNSEKQKESTEKNCEVCGKPFRFTRKDKRFCSNICRMNYNNEQRKLAKSHNHQYQEEQS
jgi:endogenous inhibitor of DNA gyrase (YacG/DUF329 family)